MTSPFVRDEMARQLLAARGRWKGTEAIRQERHHMFTQLGQGRQSSRLVAWISVLGLIIAMFAAAVEPAAASTATGGDVSVVVREVAPDTETAEDLVNSLGGVVEAQLALIGGFSATVPVANLGELAADPSVHSVTEDVSLSPREYDDDDESEDGWGGAGETTLKDVAYTINADNFWSSGYRGDGVDIAVIDTGISPVEGLDRSARVINGPDLSFESQNPEFMYLDSNGHGTHMAGIIAAYDRGDDVSLRASPTSRESSTSRSALMTVRSTSRRPSPPSTGSCNTRTTTA